MLIQKTFHVNHSLAETKDRIEGVAFYRRHLTNVKKAIVTADGMGHFEFQTPLGYRSYVDLIELEAENNQRTFRSIAGNMEVAGCVEFHEIRSNCTEVVFTLAYEFQTPLHRFLDRLTGSMDRFVSSQLAIIKEYAQRAGVTAEREKPTRMPSLQHQLAA